MNRKEKPQHKPMQGAMGSKPQPQPRKREGAAKTSAPGWSSGPRQQEFGQQTAGCKRTPEKLPASEKYSMYHAVVANPKVRLPPINTARNGSIDAMKFLDELFQGPSAGLAAKNTRKPKLGKASESKPQEKLPDIRVPEKCKFEKPAGSGADRERSDQDVSYWLKHKVELRGKTTKDETVVKKNSDQHMSNVAVRGKTTKDATVRKKNSDQDVSDVEVTGKTAEDKLEVEPQISNSSEDRIRANITSAVLDYVTSASFRSQLAQRITGEINVKIAKAVSQAHAHLHAMKFGTATSKAQDISQDLQSSNKSGDQSRVQTKAPTRSCQEERTGKLGFSYCMAALIGFTLIESRDQMMERFKSKSPIPPTASNSATEIVENVFESILASIINGNIVNPDESTDTDSSASMINNLASHVFNSVCECILQSIDSDDSQSPLQEPTGSADKMYRSQTVFRPADESDIALWRRQASSLTDITSVSGISEDEGFLVASGSLSHLDDPVTSRIETSDSDMARNVLEEVTATPGQVSNLEDPLEKAATDVVASFLEGLPTSGTDLNPVNKPTENVDHKSRSDEGAEERLVAESDVDLEQVLATPSEEYIPPEVTTQDLQLIGQQEHASLVPSPPSSEKPGSPRGSFRRRTCPSRKLSSLPNMPLSIPDKFDTEASTISQKKEDVLKRTLSLSDMKNATSLESAEKTEDLLISKAFDQERSSEPEVKGKEEDEDEGILADFIPPPQTSAIEQDLKPDEVAEERLGVESDVALEQVLATLSEENVPSEVTSQDLQLIGRQEHASLIPSPPATKKPDSPRGSARRRTHPTTKARSLPNMYFEKEDDIPDQSLQKRSHSLMSLEKGSGMSRSTSSLDEPLTSSKTSDLVCGSKKQPKPATSDASKEEPKAPKTRTMFSVLRIRSLPTKPKMPAAKPSLCDKEQNSSGGFSASLDQESRVQKEMTKHVPYINCDCQAQGH